MPCSGADQLVSHDPNHRFGSRFEASRPARCSSVTRAVDPGIIALSQHPQNAAAGL
jgi:hypothetical protein